MSLLTDNSIEGLLITNKDTWTQREDIQREKLLIENYDEQSLTPVGYDLRVGERYLKMYSKLTDFASLQRDDDLLILPSEIVAIETEEFIGMPQNKEYSGIIVSKVSMGEKGFSHISTSLDPDWEGKLIITVTNNSKRKMILKREQPFCTMILFKNESAARRECGKHPDAHITSLIRDWKLIGKTPRKVIYVWIIKILIPAIPLIWLLVNHLRIGVSSAEVALFVAVSSFLFIILDKILALE